MNIFTLKAAGLPCFVYMGVDQKVLDIGMTIGWKTNKNMIFQPLNGQKCPWSLGGARNIDQPPYVCLLGR